MNAKELRQAAETVKCSSIHSSGWIGVSQSADACANHILATVRQDDDELADPNWQVAVTEHNGYIDYFDTFLYETWSGGHGKTRGQFRALCNGLGIELKEGN